MSRVKKAISEEMYKRVEAAVKNCPRYGKVHTKLQAIKAAKKFNIKRAAEVFGVSYASLYKWIKVFGEKGVDGLKLQKGRGRKSNITVEERTIIFSWIQQSNGITIKALKSRIENELKKKICKTRTHDLMRELGFSYITPRPVHHLQDNTRHCEFKKKSTESDRVTS
jgi:transposase